MNNKMSYMKMFCKGLTPELISKAEIELGETDEIRTKAIQKLKELIQAEPHFHPCMENAFLLRFLRAQKFNVERAFKTLKNYYLFKDRYSGVLTDLKPSDIESVIRGESATWLEYRDQNYTAVDIHIGKCDINKVTLDEEIAYVLINAEIGIRVEATQISGFSMIVDFAGCGPKILKWYAAPSRIYTLLKAIEDCLPVRIKGYHIVNEPVYIGLVYKIIRIFMSKKIEERVHFHGKDLTSLHKYITPDILPEEFGGKRGPLSKQMKDYINIVLSNDDYFAEMKKYGYRGKTS